MDDLWPCGPVLQYSYSTVRYMDEKTRRIIKKQYIRRNQTISCERIIRLYHLVLTFLPVTQCLFYILRSLF